MSIGIIYCYTNKLNGKSYIGQTINEVSRKTRHLYDALQRNTPYKFHKAIRKYGIDAFEYGVIESVDTSSIDEREIFWIKEMDSYKNGYNETIGGRSTRGFKHSLEQLLKRKNKPLRKTTNKEIEQLKDGAVITRYSSSAEAKRATGISSSHIRECITNPSRRKTAGGFSWRDI